MENVLERVPIDWQETACPLCAGSSCESLIEAGDPLPGPDVGLRFLARSWPLLIDNK